jgi:hypothetical protein
MIVSMTPDERPANGTWIDCPDPDRWTRTALDGHYSFPVLPNGYIVKSGRSPLNECAAYQLANFLGVPVPDHFFFILSKDAIIQRPTQRGTVCIALDRQPVTRDSMNPKTIIKYSKNIAATHLAFSCFDRQCEWPTVILNPNKLVLIDFEGQLPRYNTDIKQRRRALRSYKQFANATYKEARVAAQGADIYFEFLQLLLGMGRCLVDANFRPLFNPHPQAKTISNFFHDTIAQRASFFVSINDVDEG